MAAKKKALPPLDTPIDIGGEWPRSAELGSTPSKSALEAISRPRRVPTWNVPAAKVRPCFVLIVQPSEVPEHGIETQTP